MNFRISSRLITALIALVFVLAACSGSDSTADATAATTSEAAETTTTTEAPETEAVIEEAAIPEVDTRTPREIAIDQLDLMLAELRTSDLVATADCVVERLDSEGIEIVGRGAPEIIAALGCDPTIANQLFNPQSFNVSETEGVCIVDGLAAATTAIPLDEAEAFFSTSTPPVEILEEISSTCGVTVEQLNQGFA